MKIIDIIQIVLSNDIVLQAMTNSTDKAAQQLAAVPLEARMVLAQEMLNELSDDDEVQRVIIGIEQVAQTIYKQGWNDHASSLEIMP